MPITATAARVTLILVFACAVLLSRLPTSCATGDASQRSAASGVFTGHARECPSPRANSLQLCVPAQPVSREAAEAISQSLSTMADKTELCAIDAIVIRSEIVCREAVTRDHDPFNALPPADSNQPRNLDSDLLLSELLTNLAKAWARQGSQERAEELFAGADRLAAMHEDYIPLVRDTVLKEWLAFETGRDRLEAALAVTRELAASYRRMLERSPHWPPMGLADTLKTEADLLDRLGRPEEAEERRQEADSLGPGP